MRKNLSLLKPQVCTRFLQNKSREKVTYLDIPKQLDLKSLQQDVKLGACQFAELDALIQKEKEPTYILICTDNQEQGYMAVTYLAAGFNKKKGRCKVDLPAGEKHLQAAEGLDEFETFWEESLEENWEEDDYRIPVIEESALKMWVCGDTGDIFSMTNLSAVGSRKKDSMTPYWMDCTAISVCVALQSQNGMGFFGGMEGIRDEMLLEGLNYFQGNDKVYILMVEQRELAMGMEMKMDQDNWFYIALNFSADQVQVKLTETQKIKYFKEVFRGTFALKHIKAAKGFSFERMARLVAFMQEKKKCELVENIVKYAVKDWTSPEMRPITNRDFAFMDRYYEATSFLAQTVTNEKGETARDRLRKNLIGMKEVKRQVFQVLDVMKYNRIRGEMKLGNGGYHNVHLMLGAPGTAKTTVAKMMGEIMMEEGMLPDNRFVCVNGAELKGMYVGQSAPKTKMLFQSYDIIVIDEAYSLTGDNGETDSYSKEAIAQLIIELEEHSMDKLMIFAGYGGRKVSEGNNKMKDFLNANPGIRSRITSTIYFDSYSPEEMVQIFFHMAQLQNYILDEDVREAVYRHFDRRVRDDNFGNGREARRLLETSAACAASRVLSQNKKRYTKMEMQNILCEDVKKALWQEENAEEIQQGCAARHAIGFCS
ncbi:MAG: AAA family ATPase [Lachnospiraceae bacterium]|jgi:hypothetical protein|nr:AAA family ATPase [Lachnospiraceae bacterium]